MGRRLPADLRTNATRPIPVGCIRLLGEQGCSLIGDDSCFGCYLAPLSIGDDQTNIEFELRGKLLSDGANLVDNRIAEHGYSSINSSGVQITGHANPFCVQIAWTVLLMAALAMWAQFHVIRKSM